MIDAHLEAPRPIRRKVFFKRFANPPANHLESIVPIRLSVLGQNRSGHPSFAVPADKISLPKAPAQNREERARGDNVDFGIDTGGMPVELD